MSLVVSTLTTCLQADGTPGRSKQPCDFSAKGPTLTGARQGPQSHAPSGKNLLPATGAVVHSCQFAREGVQIWALGEAAFQGLVSFSELRQGWKFMDTSLSRCQGLQLISLGRF